MKTILVGVLLLAGLVTLAVGQSTYVDFTTPATLNFVLNYSSGTNFSNQSFSLADGGAANVTFPTNNGDLFFSIADDTTVSAGGQWSFALGNPNLSNAYTVNGFTVSFAGLFPADSRVITGVNFLTGASSPTLLSGTTGAFDTSTGTFTLTNSSSFAVPANSTITLTGNFDASAVPEPAESVLLAAFSVMLVVIPIHCRRTKTA